MTKFWPVLGIFLLWSLFALFIHEYIGNSLLGDCAVSHTTTENSIANENSIATKEPTEAIPIASITENDLEYGFVVKAADGNSVFNFKNGFEISSLNGSVTMPSTLAGLKDSVYNYLNNNQDKELIIAVKYLASEANINGIHLGRLREGTLKKIFIDAGINPNKITTKVVESTYDYNTTNHYYDAISLQFNTIRNERIAEVEKSIANKTLYSNFAVKDFLPDRELVAYTIELKKYLKKYPNKKVYLEGHTDSVGTNNYAFGLDRANNVKDYFISQDISASIIKASSRGEDEPIADNYSERGRAKNRRIEITIK